MNLPNTINHKFFAFSKKPLENATISEFASGRKVGFLNNTKNLFGINCQITFTKEEESLFWSWYFNSLGGTTGQFTCSELSTKSLRFVSIPDPQDTDQTTTTLSFELEEV